MSDIKPALTPEQWKKGEKRCDEHGKHMYTEEVVDRGGDLMVENYVDYGAPYRAYIGLNGHAVAALCLRGQPFGFTWDDVDDLRRAAFAMEDTAFDRLADRIAALLPPRTG